MSNENIFRGSNHSGRGFDYKVLLYFNAIKGFITLTTYTTMTYVVVKSYLLGEISERLLQYMD